jgi:hypothetical protein
MILPMHIKQFILFSLISIALFFAEACKKDGDDPSDPNVPQNEPETITSVRLTFSGEDASVATYNWRDADGPGGGSPSVDSILLTIGVEYSVSVTFWDESKDPPQDLTEEVREEADEHILCFETDLPPDAMQIVRTDSDGKYEIGLSSEWSASVAQKGQVTVSLKHQPENSKDGTCGPGDTDVEVQFPIACRP